MADTGAYCDDLDGASLFKVLDRCPGAVVCSDQINVEGGEPRLRIALLGRSLDVVATDVDILVINVGGNYVAVCMSHWTDFKLVTSAVTTRPMPPPRRISATAASTSASVRAAQHIAALSRT